MSAKMALAYSLITSCSFALGRHAARPVRHAPRQLAGILHASHPLSPFIKLARGCFKSEIFVSGGNRK
jgi:hypothetical protein